MTRSPCHSLRARWPRLPLLLGAVLAMPGASTLQAQGIGYDVAPLITYLRWDDALGLDDDYLIGGRLGLRFGGRAELQGYALTRTGILADPEPLPSPPGFVPPAGQEVTVRAFGVDLGLNLTSGTTVPFLRAGGGVLRFEPEGFEATNQILLKAGAGLRFELIGGLGGEVFAENWAFRVNRFRFFAPPDAFTDPEADELRQNLALGAALNIPLGGDPAGAPLGGGAIPLELLGGQLRFNGDLGLPRQNLLGARVRLNLTPLIGLGGFYWRGMNDDFDDTAPIQAYGGEVQLNLGSGPGLIPYLLAGAGQLDFREAYRDEEGEPRADRTALILGGGVALALSERARVNVGVRDWILGEDDLETRRTDQLTHSFQYTAGLSVAIGGGSRRPA